MNKSKTYIVILCGLAAGAINGLLGSGGGMVLVPLLISAAKLESRKAFASSIAIILPICIISIISYIQNSSISIAGALPYLIGGFFGGIISGFTYQKIPVKLLQKFFGVIIIFGGLRGLWL